MSDTELLQDEDLLRLAQMRGGGGGMRDVSDAAFEPAGADAPPVEAPGGAALPETAPEQSGSSEVAAERQLPEAATAGLKSLEEDVAQAGGKRGKKKKGRGAKPKYILARQRSDEVDEADEHDVMRRQQADVPEAPSAAAAAVGHVMAAHTGTRPPDPEHHEEQQHRSVEEILADVPAGVTIRPLTLFSYLVPAAAPAGGATGKKGRRQRAPAKFYASPPLLEMVVNELRSSSGGFTAAVQQLSNVATLPGIVGASIGMPDIHSGYGFAIGNVAAFDVNDPEAVVSPGGVGFDINCGVRLLATNLTAADVLGDDQHAATQDRLADELKRVIPVGVGASGGLGLEAGELERVMREGMRFLVEKGLAWPEDLEVTEEGGCLAGAKPAAVSGRARARGQGQVGTLGSGNHYCEVQVVEEVFDEDAAGAMGIGREGTVCVMIHSGSRGLGHQVCTDYLQACDAAMAAAGLPPLVDRQLACMPINSKQGQDYLAAMACAANFAFCNRAVMAAEVRRAFATVFGRSARDLGMHQVYDVSHNIAKFEEHVVPDVTLTSRGCGGGYSAATAAGSGGEEAATRLGAPSPAAAGTSEGGGETEAAGGAAGFSTAEPDAAAAASAAPAGGAAPAVETGASATTGGRAAGKQKVVETGGIGRAAAGKTMKAEKTKTKQLLVHRKGATRAFAPGHPALPAKYAACGQPVLIGGSMGTASYVMAGTQGAMDQTFGSTCHGAGRALSRSKAMEALDSKGVLALQASGVAVRIATRRLAAEEAPESYKDVSEVVETCHRAGISRKVVRLRPIIVVKG